MQENSLRYLTYKHSFATMYLCMMQTSFFKTFMPFLTANLLSRSYYFVFEFLLFLNFSFVVGIFVFLLKNLFFLLKYRGYPVSTISISTIPDLTQFENSAK